MIEACNILNKRLQKVAAEEFGEEDSSTISLRMKKYFTKANRQLLFLSELVRKLTLHK